MTKTKIYLAGKWSDKEMMRFRMTELEKMGYEITHDWTEYEADETNTKSSMADNDIDGVYRADIYIGIFEDMKYPYRGTFTELGSALTCKKFRSDFKVYVVCPSFFEEDKAYATTNCFFHASAIEHVKDWNTMKSILTDKFN